MNCENAYYYLLNQLSELREQLENLQTGQESINIPLFIYQLQQLAEEIRIEDNQYEVVMAPRCGGSAKP